MPDAPRSLLRCPECGAPLPADAANAAVQCAQCGATSAPAPRGPETIVQNVVVERIVVRDADGNATTFAPLCPRCQTDLVGTTSDGIVMLGCAGCGGVWLDNAGSAEVVRRRHPEVEELATRAESHALRHEVVARFGSPSPLHCPVCSRDMRRVRSGNVADIDLCARHGTWFDAGELQRVSKALHLDPATPPKKPTPDAIEAAEARLRAAAAETPVETMPRDFGIAHACGELLGATLNAVAMVAIAESNRKF